MMEFNGIDFSQVRELRQVAEGRRMIREIREEMNRAAVMSLAELDRKMMDEARRSLEESCRDMARAAAAQAIIGDLASELTPEDFARVRESKRTPPASAAPADCPAAAATTAAREAPTSASAPAGRLPEAVPDGKPEAAEARQDRRLLELRSMGADFVPHGKGWRVTGKRGALAALVKREAGQPMDTKDGVRKDLQRAVQRERERNGRLSR